MFVDDYMTPKPRTVAPATRLSEAQMEMNERRIHHLPVLDTAGRLVGIISDRDVRTAVGYDRTLGDKLTVSEVMTVEPTTVAGTATLDEAISIFSEQRFGALPVMGCGKLTGILTRTDVLRAFHQVLGLDVPGHRVEIALPDGCADIARAFSALTPVGDAVVSGVVSRMRRDGGEPSLYLRIGGSDLRNTERLLRAATLIVLEPEHA